MGGAALAGLDVGACVAVAAKRRRPSVHFSADVARAILWRVAGGEALSAICKDDGMPTHGTVGAWAKAWTVFGAKLARARAAAGWPDAKHPGLRYCPVAAAEIYARLCEGEALYRICEDPGLPAHSTVYRWREKVPAFAAALREARAVQAERYCDMGWEIASGVTPGDAYATHVKLMQLRWQAGVLAPARYGKFKPVEAAVVVEEPPEEQRLLYRHFKVEERLSDGACRVVAFTPDPDTGRLVREVEEPEWKPCPPALRARWRSRKDSARAGGVVGVNAPPPLEDGDWDPAAE